MTVARESCGHVMCAVMVTFPEHGGGIGSSRLLALAAGAPAGFCSDTGGSCRNPANLNGVVGFRPTGGCYNGGDGVVPLSTTRDTVGTEPPHSTYLLTLDELQWRKRHAPGSETGMMECLTCRTDRSHCDGCNLVRQDLQRLPQGVPHSEPQGAAFWLPDNLVDRPASRCEHLTLNWDRESYLVWMLQEGIWHASTARPELCQSSGHKFCPLHDRSGGSSLVQTIPVHDAAMEHLKAAGAVIVPVDITDLLATNKVLIGS